MLDFALPIFNIIMSKYYANIVNQIWWETWNPTQPLDDMAFDHVIAWQIKTLYHNFYKGYKHQTWMEQTWE